MKKKYFLMCALAGFMFASCSESLPGDDGGGGGDNADGDAWVSLNIQTGTSTKALNDPKTENGTADETKVSKVMVIFFDNHLSDDPNPVVVDKVTWDDTDSEIASPGQPIGSPTKAFKVKSTSKAFLVVLNPSNEFESNVTLGANFSVINKAFTDADVSAVIGAEKNNFMMSNAKGKLEPTTVTNESGTVKVQDVALKTYPTAREAESNPQALTVDRVAAKVRLFAQTKYEGNGLDVTTVGWTLNVTNKKYYPMSERTATWMETTGRGSFISPYDKWHFGSYRKDPNYTEQNVTMKDITADSYTENYAYYTHETVTPGDWAAVTAGPSTGPNGSKTPALYCLENTQDEDDNYEAYTTHVLLKATSVPTGLKLPNNGGNYEGTGDDDVEYVDGEGKVISGHDWIKIGTGYYSYALLLKYIESELTAKYTDQNPETFGTATTTAFNNYLAYLAGKSVPGVTAVTLPTKQEFTDANYPTIAEGAKTIAADFMQAGVSTHGADSYGTVSYFKGGDSYYTIMIKHDNDDDNTNNKLGEFGVVRNSVYDITINSIMNPGYPTIPTPDPGKKDEEEEAYMSIQIDINPWTWYTQGVDL